MHKPGTYQTRISDYADLDRLEGDAALAAYAGLYGRVQRKPESTEGMTLQQRNGR